MCTVRKRSCAHRHTHKHELVDQIAESAFFPRPQINSPDGQCSNYIRIVVWNLSSTLPVQNQSQLRNHPQKPFLDLRTPIGAGNWLCLQTQPSETRPDRATGPHMGLESKGNHLLRKIVIIFI